MIVRVARRAAAAGARGVIVATDDRGIHRAVTDAGYRALMTRKEHVSGSDRVEEVARREGWPDDTLVVNVQGDEPLLPPEAIRQVADALAANPALDAATLCESFEDARTAANPNCVKVVRDARNRALYFSRAPIPWMRADGGRAGGRHAHGARPEGLAAEGLGPQPVSPAGARPDGKGSPAGPWLRHLGIYGYRAATLRRFVALAPGALERAESLEQLRLLENGMSLLVLDSCRPVPGGVDTPEDLERVRRLLRGEARGDSRSV